MKKILLNLSLLLITSTGFCQWNQLGSDIDGEAVLDRSGVAVAISPDGLTVVVGAKDNDAVGSNSGHARVYNYNGTNWVQLGSDIDGEAAFDNFGEAVSISTDGLTIAIGARRNDGGGIGNNTGHVRIYQFNGTNWVQKGADIDGTAAGDYSGKSVSLSDDGSIVAIGSPNSLGAGGSVGHVKVFQYNGTNWIQQGVNINGALPGALFGTSIKLSNNGSIVAVGAEQIFGGVIGTDGYVGVFQFNGTNWVQQGAYINGEALGDHSGRSVSLSGDGSIVAIGATENDDGGTNAGHTRIFQFNGTNWVQQGLDIDGEAANDRSARSVSLSDNGLTIAIGAETNDGTGSNAGHVRVFQFNGTSWIQQGLDIDGEFAFDLSGHSLSISDDGSKVVIGAADNTNGQGHARVFTFCPSTSSSFTVNECRTYTVPSGDETYNTPGMQTVMDTIPNACGSDSIMTITLIIAPVIDTTTTLNGLTITANESSATYSWLDCNNSNSVMLGETAQSFTATANGNYAVEITQNGCKDTSECVNINTVGINENNPFNQLTIYPNPTSNVLNIKLNNIMSDDELILYNSVGQIVLSQKITTRNTIINTEKLPNGIYLLNIKNRNITERIILNK